MSESKELNLSPSVKSAKGGFPADEPISAVAFAKAILKLHHIDYAGGKASALVLDEAIAARNKQPVETWLQDIRTLFDASFAPELHGRLVIIGLSLLEPNLRQQLQHDGFLTALEQEIKEPPLDKILTPKGRELYEPPDSVPNQPDDPLQKIGEDQLGRAAFARYLAKRIFAVPRENEGAYSIHLYGPWGAGKSTLLNFLRAELQLELEKNEKKQGEGTKGQEKEDQVKDQPEQKDEKEGKWLVVEFNAWRHQHIRPPWWTLMDSIFRRTKGELCAWQRFLEYWWRFNTGRVHYLIGLTVLAWVLVMGVFLFKPDTASLSRTMAFWAMIAESVGSILAVIITIWTAVQAVSRSLLLGSARAAQSYVELTQDPMNEMKKRFNGLIDHLKPHRVAIFVDDLDRCQSDYVVELLEGIQTLFREAPVVFVVAADRRWLNACYEEVYVKLKPLVGEPGKSLGALFLEKAFQFSASVPGIPDELKKEYWQNLIQVKAGEAGKNLQAARQKAKEMMAEAKSEGDVLDVVNRSRGLSFFEQRAIREKAVERLAAPEFLERNEHVLKPFVPLLEPNPRAMKRLVNAYSVNRALTTLAHLDIERDQLALWTIVTMRWPKLADYLEKQPEMVEKIGQPGISGVPDEIKALFNDEDVANVVRGKPVEASLDRSIVERCAMLQA